MKIIKALGYVLVSYAKSLVFQLNFLTKSRIVKKEVASLWEKFRPWDTNLALIRVGPDGDGGYLVPEDFKSVTSVFSPGVSDESRFELAMAQEGIPCFLADASVSGPGEVHDLISFVPKFLGTEDNELYMRLDSWVSQNEMTDAEKLLQMDIEGFEWRVFEDTSSKVLEKFKIMIVEFHDLHNLANADFRRSAQIVIKKILETHVVLHVHGNNNLPSLRVAGKWIPQVVEITFHSKNEVFTKSTKVLPDPGDVKNSKWLPRSIIKF